MGGLVSDLSNSSPLYLSDRLPVSGGNTEGAEELFSSSMSSGGKERRTACTRALSVSHWVISNITFSIMIKWM